MHDIDWGLKDAAGAILRLPQRCAVTGGRIDYDRTTVSIPGSRWFYALNSTGTRFFTPEKRAEIEAEKPDEPTDDAPAFDPTGDDRIPAAFVPPTLTRSRREAPVPHPEDNAAETADEVNEA